ncbi:MAG: hypothetical protein HN348_06975 [Proteobacteria bacterium]|jgi:hypothetical protein|nr:hypothetical protein [Pseudomonadota bacterium]
MRYDRIALVMVLLGTGLGFLVVTILNKADAMERIDFEVFSQPSLAVPEAQAPSMLGLERVWIALEEHSSIEDLSDDFHVEVTKLNDESGFGVMEVPMGYSAEEFVVWMESDPRVREVRLTHPVQQNGDSAVGG